MIESNLLTNLGVSAILLSTIGIVLVTNNNGLNRIQFETNSFKKTIQDTRDTPIRPPIRGFTPLSLVQAASRAYSKLELFVFCKTPDFYL